MGHCVYIKYGTVCSIILWDSMFTVNMVQCVMLCYKTLFCMVIWHHVLYDHMGHCVVHDTMGHCNIVL